MSPLVSVKKFQQGDVAGFDELYRRYYPVVFSWCKSQIKQRADAEDLTQEIFMYLFRRLPTFRVTTARFESWLYLVTKCRIIDSIRRQQSRDYFEEESAASGVLDPSDLDLSMDIKRCWLSLSSREQDVAAAVVRTGGSGGASRLLGIPRRTVCRRLKTVREKLAPCRA